MVGEASLILVGRERTRNGEHMRLHIVTVVILLLGGGGAALFAWHSRGSNASPASPQPVAASHSPQASTTSAVRMRMLRPPGWQDLPEIFTAHGYNDAGYDAFVGAGGWSCSPKTICKRCGSGPFPCATIETYDGIRIAFTVVRGFEYADAIAVLQDQWGAAEKSWTELQSTLDGDRVRVRVTGWSAGSGLREIAARLMQREDDGSITLDIERK